MAFCPVAMDCGYEVDLFFDASVTVTPYESVSMSVSCIYNIFPVGNTFTTTIESTQGFDVYLVYAGLNSVWNSISLSDQMEFQTTNAQGYENIYILANPTSLDQNLDIQISTPIGPPNLTGG